MISKSQTKLIRSLEMKKHRQREGLFVAEGPKVGGDLLAAGFEPHLLFATEEWAAPAPLSSILVTPDELRKLSFLQHPQHVLAVFHIPQLNLKFPLDLWSLATGGTQEISNLRSTSGRLLPEGRKNPQISLALDGIQDPGNLGTIIRIADWFGIDTIVCSPDTADAWSPKVVQATMGSIARVRIVYTDLQEYLSKATVPICGTLLDGENIYAQKLPQEAIIVMGNEGNGISPAIRQLVTHRLLIPPFRPGAESLNVAIATAITCSEFRRRTE